MFPFSTEPMSNTRLLLGITSVIALLGLFSSGCTSEEPATNDLAARFDTTGLLKLETEWRYNTNYSGFYTDQRTGHEFIFSGDPVTYLKIRVFDSAGRRLYDVPLSPAYERIDRIHCLTMLAPDSFALLDDRGERLLILDTTGRVVRDRDFKDARCDTNNDLYELYASNTGLTCFNNKLYLGPALLGTCNNKPFYMRSDTSRLNAQRYFALATGKCQLAEIDPRAHNAGVRFGASEILKHLTDTPRETIGMANTATANDKLFVFSDYSPCIHEIDTTTLNVAHKVRVNYLHGEVGITPPPISEEDLQSDGQQVRSASKAYILSVSYDRSKHCYLIGVCHEVSEKAPEEERSWHRPWSLVVLNEQYQPVSEYVLSGNEYSGTVILGMRNGTWILQRNLDPKSFNQPKVFRRLLL